jgi:Skp family chaperone for outer membrane proteins
MNPYLNDITQEGLWIWAVFALGAISSYLFLAQSNAASLGAAIIRGIRSIVVSPFHYLRKTITELSLGDANPRLQNVDHYLLRRLLTAVQVGLLLSIFFGAGLAIASAVVAFLPPSYLRQALANNSEQLAKVEASLKPDTDAVVKQDFDWNNQREQLISEAQQNKKQKDGEAQRALHDDESAVKSPEGMQVLNTLRNFFTTRGTGHDALDQAKAFVSRMPLGEPEAKSLISYCDHRQELDSLSNRAPKSLDQIRTEVQPDHATLAQRVSDETSQDSDLKATVKRLQDLINDSYQPGRFVLTLLLFFLIFIPYVWTAGTAIEMFSMALYLSNDVKQIRTQGERSPAYY